MIKKSEICSNKLKNYGNSQERKNNLVDKRLIRKQMISINRDNRNNKKFKMENSRINLKNSIQTGNKLKIFMIIIKKFNKRMFYKIIRLYKKKNLK